MFIKEIFVEEVIRSYEAQSPTVLYKKLDLFNPIFYKTHLTYEVDEETEPTCTEEARKVA